MKQHLQNKMAKYLLIWCIAISICGNASAQNWQNLGNAGFSDSTATYTVLVLDGNGTPYVGYKDASHSGKATVKKYDGTNWVTVGNPGFTDDSVSFGMNMAVNSDGVPYIIYQAGDTEKGTVMKYDGNSWVTVGSPHFTAGSSGFFTMAIDKNGTPYVAYEDGGSSNDGASVMKFDGNNWVSVGNAGFSAGLAYFTTIAIDSSGIPYVGYTDYGYGVYGKMTVMKYDGSNWMPVGTPVFSPTPGVYTSLVIDHSGTPYIEYVDDLLNTFTPTVMKYDGSSWQIVGDTTFATGQTYDISFAVDSSGAPYVAYVDEAHDNKITVMKYDSSSWRVVGDTAFTAGAALNTSLAISKSGQLFVAYQDGANNEKASVMTFKTIDSTGTGTDSTGTDSTGTDSTTTMVPQHQSVLGGLTVDLYPDPATDKVTIDYNAFSAANTSLLITNVTGQTLITKELGKTQSGIVTIPIAQLPAGVYILQVTSGTGVIKRKLIKQ